MAVFSQVLTPLPSLWKLVLGSIVWGSFSLSLHHTLLPSLPSSLPYTLLYWLVVPLYISARKRIVWWFLLWWYQQSLINNRLAKHLNHLFPPHSSFPDACVPGCKLCSCVKAGITKHRRLDDSNHRHVLPCSSREFRARDLGAGKVVPFKVRFLGSLLLMPHSSSSVPVCFPVTFSSRDPARLDSSPRIRPRSCLITSLKVSCEVC